MPPPGLEAPEFNGTSGPEPSKQLQNQDLSLKFGFDGSGLNSRNHGTVPAEKISGYDVAPLALYCASRRSSGIDNMHTEAQGLTSFYSGGLNRFNIERTAELNIDSRQHSQVGNPWSQSGAVFNAVGIDSDPRLHSCQFSRVECWAGKGLNSEDLPSCFRVDVKGLSYAPRNIHE